MYWPPLGFRCFIRHPFAIHPKDSTYLFGFPGVAEHQSPPSGHKSVTLMTTLFVTFGMNGGVDV